MDIVELFGKSVLAWRHNTTHNNAKIDVPQLLSIGKIKLDLPFERAIKIECPTK
jgi:hypothetical protein